jgi:hypothetical protein
MEFAEAGPTARLAEVPRSYEARATLILILLGMLLLKLCRRNIE